MKDRNIKAVIKLESERRKWARESIRDSRYGMIQNLRLINIKINPQLSGLQCHTINSDWNRKTKKGVLKVGDEWWWKKGRSSFGTLGLRYLKDTGVLMSSRDLDYWSRAKRFPALVCVFKLAFKLWPLSLRSYRIFSSNIDHRLYPTSWTCSQDEIYHQDTFRERKNYTSLKREQKSTISNRYFQKCTFLNLRRK